MYLELLTGLRSKISPADILFVEDLKKTDACFPVEYSGRDQQPAERCALCWCCSVCARSCGCEAGEEGESCSDMEQRVMAVQDSLEVQKAEVFRKKFVEEEEMLFADDEAEDEDGEDEDDTDSEEDEVN